MRFLVHYGRTFTILLFLFPVLGFSAYYLYLKYNDTKKDVFEIVQDNLLNDKHELLHLYVEYLTKEYGENFIKVLKKDEKKRLLAEKELLMLKTTDVKFLYLLYVDKHQKLRYLLDTTQDLNEKGEFQQRFFPQADIWTKALKNKKTEVTTQTEIDKLWISMAYPIVVQEKTTALLGIDFSHEEHLQINKTLVPLENIYLYSAIFVVVMLISAFFQLLIYYKHRKKSFIDPLTGMYNRQYLNELLKKYPVGHFQILIMDLDHFKQVNDIYGHDSGDIVLHTVSQRIRSVIRRKDILIRYGGEEFLLLISDKEKYISLTLAERIRQNVKAYPINLDDCQLNITISMGLNPNPSYSKTFEHAVKIADQGLYKAKHLGRDRIEIFDDKQPTGEESLQKLCDVKDALDLDRIYCIYQPMFDTQTQEVYKYELLIRMENKEGKLIVPDKFLSSIRYTQVYIEITRRVLQQAFNALREHDVKLSINLDLQDLFNDEILDLFVSTFEKNLSFAQRLSIEILEHEEILEFKVISERLSKLRKLGIKIAIDDFGSGFANYKYMLNMHIDILKIDGSLIANIDKNENAYKIVQSIQILATNLGIQTVAEQVETQGEFDCIKQLNIDFAQGYYLAKPSADFLS